MSGGAMAVAPAALLVPIAVAATVAVAGVGLAAALMIRAAQAGTEATGRALERFADEMERQAQAQDDREVQARLWQLAACAVVRTNQEVRLLAARAEKVGAGVLLPEPFDLTGHGLADTRGWATHAQQVLAVARAEVERAEAERERRVLLDRLPTPADDSATSADLLADFAQTLRSRTEPVDTTPHVDRGQVRAEIDTILARVDIDATAAEREEVIVAAARAAKQTEIGASRTFLDALARKVDAEINQRAADRRESAGWLVALEHPVIVEAIAETAPPLPPFLAAIDRLRAVVRGDAELAEQDRRQALDALAWAQQRAEQRRLLEAMAEIFASLGYSVTTGMLVDHTTGLCVARDGWRGEHSADVWIDEAGNVQWRMVELVPGARAEAGRCEDINQSVRVLGDQLAGRGFDADVQVPAVPVKPVQRCDGSPPGTEVDDHAAEPARKERPISDDEETPR